MAPGASQAVVQPVPRGLRLRAHPPSSSFTFSHAFIERPHRTVPIISALDSPEISVACDRASAPPPPSCPLPVQSALSPPSPSSSASSHGTIVCQHQTSPCALVTLESCAGVDGDVSSVVGCYAFNADARDHCGNG